MTTDDGGVKPGTPRQRKRFPDRQSATIGAAALVVSGGILLSRILGFLRNSIMFGLLGATADKSLYDAAFALPDYLYFLLAGGYLSITLVPILARHHAEGREDLANQSFSAVVRVVGALLVGMTLIMLLAAGPINQLMFPRVADQTRLTELTRIALLSQIFFGVGAMLMAVQYARRRYLFPTLAPVIYNLGIIVGGLVGNLDGDPSPESFLWGGLVGAIVGSFILQLVGAYQSGLRFDWGRGFRHPALAEYFALAFPLMIGQTVVALDEQWPRWFGQLAGPEAIGQLVGARQLNMVPVGLIAQAAGVAAYPFLADLIAQRRHDDLRVTVLRSVTSGLTVAGLATALVVGLASPIVGIAYEHGRFEAADTGVVAGLLVLYAVSIPFWVVHQVYGRAFYAMRRMWMPVLVGSAVTAVTIPLLVWFAGESGAEGVAIGSSIGIAMYAIVIGIMWHRGGDNSEIATLLTGVVRIAIAAVVSGLAVVVVSDQLANVLPRFVVFTLGVLVGTAVYLIIGRWLALPGLIETQDRVLGRLRRLRAS